MSEVGCWNITSGANHHIKIGLEQLQSKFEMELFLLFKEHVSNSDENFVVSQPNKYGSFLKNSIRFPFLLIKNHIYFLKYFNMIKKSESDFIYERASFLNYNGIIISKILRKKHFYEVNSVCFNENKNQFSKVFFPFIYFLENYFVSKSDHVFFVDDLKRFLQKDAFIFRGSEQLQLSKSEIDANSNIVMDFFSNKNQLENLKKNYK